MTMTTQRATTTRMVEEPIRVSSAPIHKRVIFDSASQIPAQKRTYAQKVAALTYGQLFGAVVGFLSTGKILFDFNFNREGSFLDKYLMPILGAISGIILAISSGKPKDTINQNSTVNKSGSSTNINSAPPSQDSNTSPRVLIYADSDDRSNTTGELTAESPPSRPTLRLVSDDGSQVASDDDALLERVYDELGFNFKKMPNDENTLSLRYWFAKAYLQYNSKQDGDPYSTAIKLIDAKIQAMGMSEKVLEARSNRTIQLTSKGIVLCEENLNLNIFKRILGIIVDSATSVRKKREKFFRLFSLLRMDQRLKLEQLFHDTYFHAEAK